MSGKLLSISKDKLSDFKIIVNKAQTEAELLIYGSVGDDYWDDAAVSAKKFSDELNKLPSTISKIILRLNSPGGSVFDGIAIYERLKQHKASVDVYIDGISASIATVIMMAGDNIFIGEGSMIMIHKPLTMTWGNRDEHDKSIVILDKIEDQMTGIYARKTGKTRAEISNMLQDDYWMTAEEALTNGFVTEILAESENIRVAASMIQSAKWINLRKAPEMKDTAARKKKIEEIKNKIEGSMTRISAVLPKSLK